MATCGQFKTTYREDLKVWKTLWLKSWFAFLFMLMILFPILNPANCYLLYITNICGIAVIGSIGLNMLSGVTGQISIGHAAFLAIGAYTSAILTATLKFPFPIALIISGFVAALLGLVVGLPSLRIKGLYLLLSTMAFYFITLYVLVHWKSLTGGVEGIEVQTKIGSFELDTDLKFYFLIMPIVVLLTAFARNFLHTKPGRACIAIRDRDIAAETIGVNLFKYKTIAFGISSFYAGIAGSLFGHYIGWITPEHFPFSLSIEYLAMIIVGGLGSVLGSIFGAIFIIAVPEGIRLISHFLSNIYPDVIMKFIDLKGVIFGLIIIGFLVFEPEGLAGRWEKIKIYFKNWPYAY